MLNEALQLFILIIANWIGYEFLVKRRPRYINIIARSFFSTLENVSKIDQEDLRNSLKSYQIEQKVPDSDISRFYTEKVFLLFPSDISFPVLVGALEEDSTAQVYVQGAPSVSKCNLVLC